MTFLKKTANWENKLLGMKAVFLQMLLPLFSPFLVSIHSFDSLGWKLGQSAEEHKGSSPVLCSYLFTASGSPSKDLIEHFSAAAQRGPWPRAEQSPREGLIWTHSFHIREETSLYCIACQGKAGENIPNGPKENWPHYMKQRAFTVRR